MGVAMRESIARRVSEIRQGACRRFVRVWCEELTIVDERDMTRTGGRGMMTACYDSPRRGMGRAGAAPPGGTGPNGTSGHTAGGNPRRWGTNRAMVDGAGNGSPRTPWWCRWGCVMKRNRKVVMTADEFFRHCQESSFDRPSAWFTYCEYVGLGGADARFELGTHPHDDERVMLARHLTGTALDRLMSDEWDT